MRRQSIFSLASLLILGLSLGPVGAQQPPDPAPSAEAGIDVQTRGPLHEAFAQPYSPDPQPTPVVPRQPPPPVPEQPPEQKPAGENVQWLPGYWAWDTDRNDFSWVSGGWRVPPPGREWVPGSWTQVDGGWRWVPGTWKAAGQEQLVFQEAPPASVENGPSVPAPDDRSFYVPGCWLNRDNQYVWRPGFWQAFQPGWVWTDAQYTWTPRGCVFTGGYWDYGLEDRGLPFAPVVFTQPLWDTPGWCYRPGFAVGWDGLLGSLFARPGYGHYYFGDYYDARYRRAGFEPWHVARGRLHDSLFEYARWQHRGDHGWYDGVARRYEGRLRGSLPRPPRTFAEQSRLLRQGHGGRDVSALRMVSSVRQLHGNDVRFGRVDVQSARAVSRARNAVEHSKVSSVHESARAAAVARPLPRPASRYAAVSKPSASPGLHPAREHAGQHALTPGQAHHSVAAVSGPGARPSHPAAAAAGRLAARPRQAAGQFAASARPAPRPAPAAARQPTSHRAQPHQAHQPSQPARAPRAAPAPRRTASPRPAIQARPRPAAPRAARAPSRPAPRASGRSGSSSSGKHR